MSMDEQLKIHFYQMGIEVDFENIFSFCKFTETALEQEKIRFDEIYREKISALEDQEKSEFQHFMIEIHWKLDDVFPNMQWNSVFNTAYTIFENHMNHLCSILPKKNDTEVSLKDIKGQGIERAKIFLTKVIGITQIFQTSEWNEIKSYSKIRNVLVHTFGNLDLTQPKHKEVFDYAKKHPALLLYPDDSCSDSAQLSILPAFIYDALLCYRIILSRICKCHLEPANG
jgi:hypothetical protein